MNASVRQPVPAPSAFAPPGPRPSIRPSWISQSYTKLFIGVFFLILSDFVFFSGRGPLPWTLDIFGAFSIAAAAVLLMLPRRVTRRGKLLFTLILLYFVSLGISTIVTGNPLVSKLQAFGLDFLVDSKLFAIAFVLYSVLALSEIDNLFRRMLLIAIFFGLLNLPFLLRDLVSSTSIWGEPLYRVAGVSVPVGLFGHKVTSAHIQLMASIATLGLLRERKWRGSVAAHVVLAILALSVVVHFSVKEILALSLAFILYTLLRSGRPIAAGASLSLAIGLLAFLLTAFDNPIKASFEDRFTTFLGARAEDTVRTASYLGGFQLAADHFPFGTGASTFSSKGSRDLAYSPFYYETGIARLWGGSPKYPDFLIDTFWPKILGQAGWLGMLFYGGAIIISLTWALRLYRQESTNLNFCAAAILLSMVAISVASPAYNYDYLTPLLAIVIAYVVSRSRRRAPPRPRSRAAMPPQFADDAASPRPAFPGAHRQPDFRHMPPRSVN